MRLHTQFKLRFYGYCKDKWKNGKKTRAWNEGEEVVAVVYNTAVLGFNTFNCNTLRLWKSFPNNELNHRKYYYTNEEILYKFYLLYLTLISELLT